MYATNNVKDWNPFNGECVQRSSEQQFVKQCAQSMAAFCNPAHRFDSPHFAVLLLRAHQIQKVYGNEEEM